jgi:cob(I)alamin adenosyltransferase
MKIYTRTGDTGTTALFGGQRIAKDALRVEAYGTLDELNAMLGLAVTGLDQETAFLAPLLSRLQSQLFNIGAELATLPERVQNRLATRMPRVEAGQVAALEAAIDEYDAQLPALRQFILPGGTRLAATLHVARTVARRGERLVVRLAAQEEVSADILRYLNRLSDLLFVLARLANARCGVQDVTWQPGETVPDS